MMDAETISEQLTGIITGKPIDRNLKVKTKQWKEVQESLFHLDNVMQEVFGFLQNLSVGNLDIETLKYRSFLSGTLKTLHSGLKHLTWQAEQVAHGDYNQKISFLGNFSTSFNEMTLQLAEREAKLRQQSIALEKSVGFLKSIMDGINDWIVVTSSSTNQIIFTNAAARKLFSDLQTAQTARKEYASLIRAIVFHNAEDSESSCFNYKSTDGDKFLGIKTFPAQWDDELVFIHHIVDITYETVYQQHIETIAFMDELTKLFNRRHCMYQLEQLIQHKKAFSFCMIDADKLKKVNDEIGHDEGDTYLKKIAEELKDATRSEDIVCRLGGDEFAIIFLDCPEDIVLQKMKAVDNRLHEQSKDYPMAISYGVIHVDKSTRNTSTEIIKIADERMYVLKKSKKKATENNFFMGTTPYFA